MDYIVIDLEWNQSPQGRNGEVKELPFEIIEIGAVKLNFEREIVGTFHEVIRPNVYKTLHSKTKEIIPIEIEELNRGTPFPLAINNFFTWCNEDYRFCTWGQVDLIELQRNMDFYNIGNYIKSAIPYYDVQKLFSLEFEGKKNPKTLEYAVDYLKVDKSQSFHRALCDAWYTAKVFQMLDKNIVAQYYSYDYYHNPKRKEDEIYLLYNNYSKYISREFNTKEEVMEDKRIRAAVCFICKKNVPKKIRWFTNNAKNYYCLGFCKEHGFLKGKVRIKRTKEGRYFAVKTMKLIDDLDAAKIRVKRDEIKIRKRQKKQTGQI